MPICRKVIVGKDGFMEEIEVNGTDQAIQHTLSNSQIKIYCDSCQSDITFHTKIITEQADYCPTCFAKLQQFPIHYQVVSCLDIMLFKDGWKAIEQLRMIQSIQSFGYDWEAIADHIYTEKEPGDIYLHYEQVYLNSPEHVPSSFAEDIIRVVDVQCCQDEEEDTNIIDTTNQHTSPVLSKKKKKRKKHQINFYKRRKPIKIEEIKVYMPKRDDFQQQYDDQAQLLLAQLEFYETDTTQVIQLKYNVMKAYNKRLNERYIIKDFIKNKQLLDLQVQMKEHSQMSKKEKEIKGMMKVFERFSTKQDHQKLIAGVAKKLELEQRIKELKALKMKGVKKLLEQVEQSDEKGNLWDQKQLQKLSKTRQKVSKKPYTQIQQPKKKKISPHIQLSKDQLSICKQLSLTPISYLLIKQTITRSCMLSSGKCSSQDLYEIINLPTEKIDKLHTFLMKNVPQLKKQDLRSDLLP